MIGEKDVNFGNCKITYIDDSYEFAVEFKIDIMVDKFKYILSKHNIIKTVAINRKDFVENQDKINKILDVMIELYNYKVRMYVDESHCVISNLQEEK